ncbi:hypothetical protein GGD66_002201 [Bradyrhizobium sp. CIR48]|uniref:hypothetical protein n=1 Tax=Bradyrhizobium sp. CIR48 TaxID=2663840 RepID=UPI0016057E3E|nr:hypothetical protein [Bradyrhizobium sp. CIR48]MBB4423657.1 hypothetical protein [Bradyrhizobium sp. CIR48]
MIALNSSSPKILLPEHAGIQRGPTQDKPHCRLEIDDMGEAVLMSVPLFLPTFSALPQRREHEPAFTFCVLLAFRRQPGAAATAGATTAGGDDRSAELQLGLIKFASVMAMWPLDKVNAVSKGAAYCMKTLNTNGECAPLARAHIPDKDGNVPKTRMVIIVSI